MSFNCCSCICVVHVRHDLLLFVKVILKFNSGWRWNAYILHQIFLKSPPLWLLSLNGDNIILVLTIQCWCYENQINVYKEISHDGIMKYKMIDFFLSTLYCASFQNVQGFIEMWNRLFFNCKSVQYLKKYNDIIFRNIMLHFYIITSLHKPLASPHSCTNLLASFVTSPWQLCSAW